MSKNALIFAACAALFAALILAFLVAAEVSEPGKLVWWAYLLPLLIFALAAYVVVKELFRAELIQAMQTGAIDEQATPPAPASESTDRYPAPPPLTIRMFHTATLPPEGVGGATQLARIEEGTSQTVTRTRSAVRVLACHNLVIAILALFAGVTYPLSGMVWLAFIVTLIVTRRRSIKTSFLERFAWLGPTHVGWILATVIVVVTYLAVAAKGLSDPQSPWKPLGLALLGMTALASDRRRWRLAFENAEPANVRRDLLVLWVFKSGSVMHLASGICQEWAALGRSRLLGGGEFLGTDDWRLIWYWLRGHAGKFILKTPEDLDARMNPRRAGQASHLETFVCHDRIWKLALDRLLSDSAIVLMNLSGLSDSNRGCMYEIAVLFNRVALSRVIFLIDQENDVDYVKKIMADVWQKLDVDSINRFSPAPVVWVAQVTTSMAESRSAGTTHPLDRKDEDAALAEAKAAAHRAETSGVVRLLCAALDRSGSQANS